MILFFAREKARVESCLKMADTGLGSQGEYVTAFRGTSFTAKLPLGSGAYGHLRGAADPQQP